MPYIVTTKRHDAERDHGDGPPPYVALSRRAVATLEERRVFDATEWGGKDVGDNSQFVHPALIIRRYTPSHRMEVATVLFLHDGRVSSGHFTNAMLKPDVPLIPESGGTVGPLPDGTVIEVGQATWQDLALAAGLTFPASIGNRAEAGDEKCQREILDTFNARKAAAR